MDVLVAEDDASFRKAIRETLKMEGLTVREAEDGKEAWEKYQEHRAQIIIADYIMPNESGLELCARIRLEKQREYCYFILLTGHGGNGVYDRAMNMGVDDFLLKPIDFSILKDRVKVATRIVDHRNKVDEHESDPEIRFCSYCSNVQNGCDRWMRPERFMYEHFNLPSTHCICPSCVERIAQSG